MTRNYDLAMSRAEFDSLFMETLKGIERWKLSAVVTHMQDAARELAVGDKRSKARQKRREKRPLSERKQAAKIRRETRKAVYDAYMKSSHWFEIRSRVLARDEHKCLCCGAQATQVHHRSYHQSVMDGRDDSKLASLCRACHERVHFDKAGQRLRKSESEKQLRTMLKELTNG